MAAHPRVTRAGPAGSSLEMTDPFIQQLVDMCRRAPTRAKWVIVPSHAIGHTIGDRLARDGTSWANLRFVTPLDLALRMAGPFLVERGITPSEDTLGPALMIRLLLDLPADGGYFRPIAEQPTMGQALWSTLRELRMAGLRATDLEANAFSSTAKHRELVALLGAYERYLETHRLADMAAVFEEAERRLDFCPIQPDDCWTELPHAVWPARQRRLLDALPGERLLPRALRLSGIDRPRRVTAANASLTSPEAVVRDVDRLCWLLRPADAPPPRNDGSLVVFHAGGQSRGDRRGIPTHSDIWHASRRSRDRVRDGGACLSRLGEGPPPRMAGNDGVRPSCIHDPSGPGAAWLVHVD